MIIEHEGITDFVQRISEPAGMANMIEEEILSSVARDSALEVFQIPAYRTKATRVRVYDSQVMDRIPQGTTLPDLLGAYSKLSEADFASACDMVKADPRVSDILIQTGVMSATQRQTELRDHPSQRQFALKYMHLIVGSGALIRLRDWAAQNRSQFKDYFGNNVDWELYRQYFAKFGYFYRYRRNISRILRPSEQKDIMDLVDQNAKPALLLNEF